MPERAPSPDPLSPYFRQDLDTLAERVTRQGRIHGPGLSVGAGGMLFTDTPDLRRLFRITSGDGAGRYSAVPVVHTVTPVPPPPPPPVSESDPPIPPTPRGADLFTDDLSGLNGPILDSTVYPLVEITGNRSVETNTIVMAWHSANSLSWEFDCGLDDDDYPYPGYGSYDDGDGGATWSHDSTINIGCDTGSGNIIGDVVRYTHVLFVRRGRPTVSTSLEVLEEDKILVATECKEVPDPATFDLYCDGATPVLDFDTFKIRTIVCVACV